MAISGPALLAYKGSAEIAVNTTTDGTQKAPAVAMDPSGNFAVACEDGGQDGSGFGVFARVFKK
ncbi:MAG: hypothetical protein JW742_06925 [Candidatus Aminicenantes bacterium]|nr:hypothetical protein [Candidatus Aminicenantes bacterium]